MRIKEHKKYYFGFPVQQTNAITHSQDAAVAQFFCQHKNAFFLCVGETHLEKFLSTNCLREMEITFREMDAIITEKCRK